MSKIVEKAKDILANYISAKDLKKNLRNEGSKILFLCQCESVWSKSRSVFVELKKLGCDVSLLVVPDEVIKSDGPTVFEKEFPNDCIKYHPGIISELKPILVMLSRPYDHYLPSELRSKNLAKITSLGYIPYYFAMEEEIGLHSVRFLNRIQYYFADQDDDYEYINKVCSKGIKKKYQFNLNLGYPSFDEEIQVFERNDLSKSAFSKNKNAIKVIWNPRWTNDVSLGSSNFAKYQKELFDFILDNKDFSFVFRPHPLLFPNFIATGVMSEKDKEELLNRIDKSTNAVYDRQGDYLSTICDADILLSDYSSLIPEFVPRDKPIIYCSSDTTIKYTKVFDDIIEANYQANNVKEIIETLILIKDNKDSKVDKRHALANRYINTHKGSAIRIANYINQIVKERNHGRN